EGNGSVFGPPGVGWSVSVGLMSRVGTSRFAEGEFRERGERSHEDFRPTVGAGVDCGGRFACAARRCGSAVAGSAADHTTVAFGDCTCAGASFWIGGC